MATTAIFGAASLLGNAFTGWKLISGGAPLTSERGQALDEIGNEVVSQLYNEKTDYTASYNATADTNTPPTTIGALIGTSPGGILTQINFATDNKSAAKMDLTAHNHTDNAHTDTLLQAAHSITVPKWWGATDFLGGTGGDGSKVVSGTCSISLTHNDVEDEVGDHAEGQNVTAMITATTVWNGAVTTPAVAGWDVTSNDPQTTNTGVITTTITATKKLTLALPV